MLNMPTPAIASNGGKPQTHLWKTERRSGAAEGRP